MTRALVLGGGGPVGVAWEAGIRRIGPGPGRPAVSAGARTPRDGGIPLSLKPVPAFWDCERMYFEFASLSQTIFASTEPFAHPFVSRLYLGYGSTLFRHPDFLAANSRSHRLRNSARRNRWVYSSQ